MHWRRLASFLLGAWLTAMFFSLVLLAESFQPVEYQRSQQARVDLKPIERVEVVIGAALTVVLFLPAFVTRLAPAIGAVMLLLTLFLQIFIGPEMAYLAQPLDLVNPAKMPGEHGRLLALQGTYLAMTGVKLLLGLGLTWYLLRFKVRPHRAAGNAVGGQG